MNNPHDLAFSLLDLCPITQDGSAGLAFRRSLELVQQAEAVGYTRYWVAEHHNIPGIASAATAVVISHLAAGTSQIRVGSGGIMLPNHAPLVVAEQFGTLESLYPGRIDLGIGRAPGTDQRTARALRRQSLQSDITFAEDLRELMNYFRPATASLPVRAIPGEGLQVPIYLLGSSDYSALLAAELGLPFAFASHFAPDYLLVALNLYRRNFKPSPSLAEPYVMIGANVFVADTDQEARRLFTSLEQQFVNLARGTPTQLPPPVESMEGHWSFHEQAQVRRMSRVSLVGSPDMVRQQLEGLLAETEANEIITTAQIYDHAARLRSLVLAAEVFRKMNEERHSRFAEAELVR